MKIITPRKPPSVLSYLRNHHLPQMFSKLIQVTGHRCSRGAEAG